MILDTANNAEPRDRRLRGLRWKDGTVQDYKLFDRRQREWVTFYLQRLAPKTILRVELKTVLRLGIKIVLYS